jgi:hypothetical protein
MTLQPARKLLTTSRACSASAIYEEECEAMNQEPT